jgi:hypothetical protein
MADKGLPEKNSADAGVGASPSRRDSLPIDLARKSAAGGADAARALNDSPPPRSPVRRIVEDLGHSLRSWAGSTFTREQFVAGLKSLAWVAPLTVLIWIYAEREQLYTVPSVTIPVKVVHSDPSRVVTVLEPLDKHLLVTIKGPRGEVEAVQEQFRTSGAPVEIELERDVKAGELTIRAERIGMDRRFTSRGVSVSNAQPGTLRVLVDDLVEHEVPVVPKFSLPVHYQVKFVPPTVKIKLPQDVYRVAMTDQKLVAYADLPPNHPDLAEATRSGRPSATIKDVPLTLEIQNEHARLQDVKVVTVEVNLKAQSTRTIPFVPLWMASTEDVRNKYVITHPPTLTGVVVVGPEEALEKLMDPGYEHPPAIFKVSDADAQDAVARGEAGKTAPIQFDLPQGVTVKQPQPTATYKVKKTGT